MSNSTVLLHSFVNGFGSILNPFETRWQDESQEAEDMLDLVFRDVGELMAQSIEEESQKMGLSSTLDQDAISSSRSLDA